MVSAEQGEGVLIPRHSGLMAKQGLGGQEKLAGKASKVLATRNPVSIPWSRNRKGIQARHQQYVAHFQKNTSWSMGAPVWPLPWFGECCSGRKIGRPETPGPLTPKNQLILSCELLVSHSHQHGEWWAQALFVMSCKALPAHWSLIYISEDLASIKWHNHVPARCHRPLSSHNLALFYQTMLSFIQSTTTALERVIYF